MSQLTPDAITDEALFTNPDELGVEPPTEVADGEDIAADDDSLVLTRTESFQPVDDALRNWRDESARRMAAHAEQVTDRSTRRKKQVALVGGLLAVVATAAFVLTQGPAQDAPTAAVVSAPLNDASVTIVAAETTPEPVVAETAPEPVVAETIPEPVVAETIPEPVVAETTPEPVVTEPVAAEVTPEPVVTEPAPVTTTTSGNFDPRIVDGTLNTWVQGDTAWIQLDFLGAAPLTLRWTDATGKTAISDVLCDNRIDAATGRCYVGRNGGTIDWGIAQGATPGDWTISACNATGACAPIGSVTAPL